MKKVCFDLDIYINSNGFEEPYRSPSQVPLVSGSSLPASVLFGGLDPPSKGGDPGEAGQVARGGSPAPRPASDKNGGGAGPVYEGAPRSLAAESSASARVERAAGGRVWTSSRPVGDTFHVDGMAAGRPAKHVVLQPTKGGDAKPVNLQRGRLESIATRIKLQRNDGSAAGLRGGVDARHVESKRVGVVAGTTRREQRHSVGPRVALGAGGRAQDKGLVQSARAY